MSLHLKFQKALLSSSESGRNVIKLYLRFDLQQFILAVVVDNNNERVFFNQISYF